MKTNLVIFLLFKVNASIAKIDSVRAAVDNKYQEDILDLLEDLEEEIDAVNTIGVVEKQRPHDGFFECVSEDEQTRNFCFGARELCDDGICKCKLGWRRGNNNRCDEDVDECAEGICPDDNSYCVNKSVENNRYECTCRAGYESVSTDNHGDTLCIHEDSCFFDEPDEACLDHGTKCLKIKDNEYECHGCKEGFIGNDKFCVKNAAFRNLSLKQCTNTITPWMKQRDRDCDMMSTKKLKKVCRNHDKWTNKAWCELACFNAGAGYDGSICSNNIAVAKVKKVKKVKNNK